VDARTARRAQGLAQRSMSFSEARARPATEASARAWRPPTRSRVASLAIGKPASRWSTPRRQAIRDLSFSSKVMEAPATLAIAQGVSKMTTRLASDSGAVSHVSCVDCVMEDFLSCVPFAGRSRFVARYP